MCTVRPNIQSQSQIFLYGQSIFCLPRRPNFSDFFDLCLHWVSVVHEHGHRELLDGRLCRPISTLWPWTSHLCMYYVLLMSTNRVNSSEHLCLTMITQVSPNITPLSLPIERGPSLIEGNVLWKKRFLMAINLFQELFQPIVGSNGMHLGLFISGVGWVGGKKE